MTQGTFLFLGDSLIADFNWQERMPHFQIVNCGEQDETAQRLLNRISSITKTVSPPKLILLMVGTNNRIIGDSDYLDSLRQIIILLTSYYPTTEIITNSLLPLQLPWLGLDALEQLNSQIEPLTSQTGSCYLDIHSKFKLNPDFLQRDGRHLTLKAYNLWSKSILEFVAFLVEDDN
jgi:lysophospholipase L1-like esterase